MKKVLKVIIWLAVIAAIIGGIVHFYLQKKPAEVIETKPAVSVSLPGKHDIINYTEAVATVAPSEEVKVLPKMSGEITEVNFSLGDHVNAGDVLLSIHSDALKSLQIQVDSAKIAMNDAATALNRTRELFGAGAVSAQQMDSAESAAKSTKLAYESAQTQLDLQSGYTSVTAPISGTIGTKNAEVHGMAAPSSAICTITGESGMQISFGVPESALANIETGNTLELQKNSRTYKCTVTEISNKVSASSGLYECKADIADAGDLLSGSKAKVKLVSAKSSQVLCVPVSAVFYADGKPFVYVYDEASGKVKKTLFTQGLSDSEFMEVKSGIDEKSQIVSTWSKEIYDGAEVLLQQ